MSRHNCRENEGLSSAPTTMTLVSVEGELVQAEVAEYRQISTHSLNISFPRDSLSLADTRENSHLRAAPTTYICQSNAIT